MRKYEKYTNMWRGNIGLPGPYRSRRCQFPFVQVFKPSARSAGFFEFCVVLWLSWRVWSGNACTITRCSLFFVLFDDAKSAITQRKHKNWCENTRNTPTHVTSEHRTPRAVPLSKVSLPFRASVQAFSKKCGVFRVLRCFVIELAGLIKWCLRYHAMLIVFGFVPRHKNSDYSKKA